MAKRSIAAEMFGITDGKPTVVMIFTVWFLLVEFSEAGMLTGDDAVGEPRPWQRVAVPHFVVHDFAALEGCRQAVGKSTLMAIILCCELLLGNKWEVGMPSLKQGSRVLLRKTSLYMELLEQCFELQRKRPDNELEKFWDNGAELMVLSAGESGVKNTQGYTRRGCVLDEMHEIPANHIGFFQPHISVAFKKRRGKFYMIGVAGAKGTAAYESRHSAEWEHIQFYQDDVEEMDALHRGRLAPGHPDLDDRPWTEVFAKAEAITDVEEYNQFYRGIPPAAGSRSIFAALPGYLEPLHGNDQDFPPRYFAGVDAGKIKDQSVLAILELRGECLNLVSVDLVPLGMQYGDQVRLIRKWLYAQPDQGGYGYTNYQLRRGDIRIEVPGPGEGLYDICTDAVHPQLPGVSRCEIHYERKKSIIRGLRGAMRKAGSRIGATGREPAFGVGEIRLPAKLGGSVRVHLEELTEETKVSDKGEIITVWEHSDILSAVIVAASSFF